MAEWLITHVFCKREVWISNPRPAESDTALQTCGKRFQWKPRYTYC